MDIQQFNKLPIPTKIFLFVVLSPTLISLLYYYLFASDIYISEAKYALRVNSEAPSMGLVESFVGGSGIQFSNDDANIVMEFIQSRDIINKLDSQLDLQGHYTSNNIDFQSRFNPDNSFEDFHEYYKDMVEITTDSSTHVSFLRVRAFNPEMAQAIANKIIELSEELVNNMSNRIVDDSLQFARSEVANAEVRVRAASEALTQFRSNNRSINPGEETSAVLNIITGLESQLAESRTHLLEAQGYMQDDSTQIKVIKGKVEALRKQVLEERKRLSNDQEANTDFTRLIDSFEPLVLEQELATKQYASTLAFLEMARIEAQRKQRYLLPFVPPQMPDEAVEPERLRSVITIFFALCIIYAIGGLIWAAIKDHMRI